MNVVLTNYSLARFVYHRSKYMKPIAIAFMEAFEMTSLESRSNPPRQLNQHYDPSMWVTAWDLSSFTTNLSELKYFLYYTSRLLEDFNYCRFITIIDYKEGPIQVHPWDLLDAYNEDINIQSPFSIHRILDRFGLDEETFIHKQQNSGMLGVPGNIGFSTALHGVIAAKAVGPERVVCVGDDAIGLSYEAPEENLIPTIQTLGIIAVEKFSLRSPMQEGYMKFLKRRLDIGEFLSLSSLFNIPVFPIIDGEVPELRTPPLRFSWRDRISAAVSGVGKLLWDFFTFSSLVDQESFEIFSIFLRKLYRQMYLPRGGSLPTSFIKHPQEGLISINVAVPSIEFDRYDPRAEDWSEYLWRARPSRIVNLPVISPYPIPMKGIKGFATRVPEMRILEDIGVIEIREEFESIETFSEENHRRFRIWLKRDYNRGFPVMSYKIVGVLPIWIEDIVYRSSLQDENTYSQVSHLI
jgi:hypothetical protein